MQDNVDMYLPDCKLCIQPGCCVKIGRFDSDIWKVRYGWYTWGGNRPVCGWYLNKLDTETIKPLQLPDLDDIYMIENR